MNSYTNVFVGSLITKISKRKNLNMKNYTNTVEPGTKPNVSAWDKGGMFANKTKLSHRDNSEIAICALPSGGIHN